MARQNGLIKLSGTIGDMTYYKSKDGYLAKEKSSLSGARIASDPRFIRTRENMAEFGNAGRAGKTLRQSISLVLQNAKDTGMVPRLFKTMTQVIKTDTIDKRGDRKVAAGDVTLLTNFEFNANAVLNTTFHAPYTFSINRTTGVLSITIPAFVPFTNITAPNGATHFKLISAGAAVDFNKQEFVSQTAESGVLPWDETATADITLTSNVTAGSTLPLFLVLGIQFYQQVNSTQYPLSNSSFNALSVTAVDKP
jgi:hypothetical protein